MRKAKRYLLHFRWLVNWKFLMNFWTSFDMFCVGRRRCSEIIKRFVIELRKSALKITTVKSFDFEKFGRSYPGNFNVRRPKFAPIRAGIKRANKILCTLMKLIVWLFFTKMKLSNAFSLNNMKKQSTKSFFCKLQLHNKRY